MKTIGWGILGPGNIATRFLKDLSQAKDARLVAVGSRTLQSAEDFAEKYGFEKAYGSYQELVQDPDIDIVYIATPHTFHKEHAILAMKAGKAVLVEKPVAVNAAELEEMLQVAEENDVFFMEALWTRFFPVNRQVQELLRSGQLGQITLLKASFGFGSWITDMPENPESRLFNPELAGGCLLDVGIYCVNYAYYMMEQPPTEIKAIATKVATGVDGLMACLFQYENGAIAMLDASVIQNTHHDAIIFCEKGTVEIPDFWHPGQATVTFHDKDKADIVFVDNEYDTHGKEGFLYEIEEAMERLRNGEKESAVMPPEESLEILETLDEIRSQVGLVYPFEE